MLFGDKRLIENRMKVQLLTIRERELSLYVRNCRAIGTVASLMSGLAFISLIYTKESYFEDSGNLPKLFYVVGNTACMCFSLEIAMATTTITMYGPGLALRGPDGSMHTAVDGVIEEFERVSRLFHADVLLFIAVALSYSWTAATKTWLGAVTMTLMCMAIACGIISRRQVIIADFPLHRLRLVSGAFHDPARPQGNESVSTSPSSPPPACEADERAPPPPILSRMPVLRPSFLRRSRSSQSGRASPMSLLRQSRRLSNGEPRSPHGPEARFYPLDSSGMLQLVDSEASTHAQSDATASDGGSSQPRKSSRRRCSRPASEGGKPRELH